MQTLTVGLARRVIAGDTHSKRFESFAKDLVSAIEGGVAIVLTSDSWDLGRDGRSVGHAPRIVVAATLGKELDSKMRADLEKISRGQLVFDRAYFLTSQEDSEHSLDRVALEIASAFNYKLDITPLDRRQISELVVTHPQALQASYASEIAEYRRELRDDEEDSGREQQQLQLALATSVHEHSASLRSAAYEIEILHTLGKSPDVQIGLLVRNLSSHLKLPRNLATSVVEHYVEELVEAGLVCEVEEKFSLHPAGEQRLHAYREEAARALSEGRSKIVEELEEALGFTLVDTQATGIWTAIESKLALLFYTEGRRALASLSALVGDQTTRGQALELPDYVRQISDAAASTASGPLLAEELREAVKHIFATRDSQACQWIGRVCAAYALVCSLGLEETSGRAVRDALARLHLVADTDVILELLSHGEPDSDSVNELTKRWAELGGSLLVSRPVLEELAYHAWIADTEYRRHHRTGLTDHDRPLRHLHNVFVRSFARLVRSGQMGPSSWRSYIDEYRGAHKYDTTRVREILLDDYGFRELPHVSTNTEPAKSANAHLVASIDLRHARNDSRKRIELDKARRDAELFGSVAQHNADLRERGRGQTCHVLTSSGRLARLSQRFRAHNTSTISLHGVLYLMTLVPGTTIGLSALQSIMFDGRLFAFSDEIDRILEESLATNRRYAVPLARRASLKRRVRKGLFQLAKDHDDPKYKPSRIVAAAVEDPEVQEVLAQTIAAAVDSLTTDDRLESENMRLRGDVEALKEQLRLQKRSAKKR